MFIRVCQKIKQCSIILRHCSCGNKESRNSRFGRSALVPGEQVKKRISVLSGGERARLCMAGLLLSPYNILILDEPGNHLDVDTVEALANATSELTKGLSCSPATIDIL